MNKEKYRNLDGLRGLAALIVVFWHYSLAFLPSTSGNTGTKHLRFDYLLSSTPLHILVAGPSAVSLFFVLSGFVLSLAFFKARDGSVLTSSALRRYFRLMIPALGSILITYVALALGFKFASQSGAITGSEWLNRLWNFSPNLLGALWQGIYSLFFSPFDPNVSYNFNLWTMPYELFGSFVVFMFLALFGKMHKRWLMYIAFSLVFARSPYLGFIIGVAIADLWTSCKQLMLSLLPTHINLPILVIGLVLLAYYIPPQMNGFYSHIILPGYTTSNMPMLAQTIGGAMVILAVLSNGLISRLFESKPLQFLGNVSFSLYLLHLVFLGTMACFIFNHLIGRMGYGPALVIAGGITLPVTFIASSYYTKYVDANAIAFSRLISNYVLSSKHKERAVVVGQNTPELLEGNTSTAPVSVAD